MFTWMKEHKLALIVSTLMFALMAGVMGEIMLLDESFLSALFADDATFHGMLWTWRIGGLVTWPVFMWLLLRPHLNLQVKRHRSCLIVVLVVAALYGGGGLWLVSEIIRTVFSLDDKALVFVAPLLAIATIGLPYLYTWGFVAIYGFARDWLANTTTHGWVPKSLLATVLGIYGVGALVYLALGMVVLPFTVIVSVLPEHVSTHLLADLCAIALSTGNFASQWYAFYKVDEYMDAPKAAPYGPETMGQIPVGAPTYPAGRPAATAPVMLADGTILGPDGRVYVPQGTPAPQVYAQPRAYPPQAYAQQAYAQPQTQPVVQQPTVWQGSQMPAGAQQAYPMAQPAPQVQQGYGQPAAPQPQAPFQQQAQPSQPPDDESPYDLNSKSLS
jgi:hypothetical protein